MKNINVKNWNKLTKAEKAQYPKYVVQVDPTTKGQDYFNVRYYWTKASQYDDLLKVISNVDNMIKNARENIYLVDIYEKTEFETKEGYPLYKSALRTRVNPTNDAVSQWHLCNKENCESQWYYCTWWENDDRVGDLNCIASHDVTEETMDKLHVSAIAQY